MKKSAYILLLLTLVGCASIHEGEYAKEIDKDGKVIKGKVTRSGIVVSGSEVTHMASKHFTQLDFTFENTTSKWIEVDNITISYMNKKLNKLVKVPLGQKLGIWAKAAQQNASISDHNFNTVMAGIAGVAAIGGSFSKSRSTRQLALGLVSASGGALAYSEIKNKLNTLQLSQIVPEAHLLNMPLYIPPGLHTKKWITIYLEDPYNAPYMDKVKVSYRINSKVKESILLELRSDNTGSRFQQRYQDHWKRIKKKKRQKKGSFKPY
jgi:hypothetical protein